MKSISVTVSNRGYIVLPAKMRKELKIKSGMRVLLTQQEDRVILRPVSSFTDKLSGLTRNTIGENAEDVAQYIDSERDER